MKKPMKIMLICLAVVFGGVFGFRLFQAYMVKKFLASMKQEPTVSTMIVDYQSWQPEIKAAGSLRAVQGVDVTTKVGGIVKKIYFKPGSIVKKDTLLLQLDDSGDIAQWNSLKSNAELARSVYKRDKAQYAIGAISKAVLNADLADMKSKIALAEQQASNVGDKLIQAPFTGKLGINLVNVGQYLSPGTKIINLQSLDPMYVDFYVPQQVAIELAVGQKVRLEGSDLGNSHFTGTITTIDSAFDPATRNVEIEATLANPKEQLKSGMFATVIVETGIFQKYLTLPQTAIAFNPYGSSVYLVKTMKPAKKGKPAELMVMQTFVTTGQTRGDQIAVLTGLHAGDQVVTSGQLKLRNNMTIHVNNTVQPLNNPAPTVVDE